MIEQAERESSERLRERLSGSAKSDRLLAGQADRIVGTLAGNARHDREYRQLWTSEETWRANDQGHNVPESTGKHSRYRLLETLRQFGNENLTAEEIGTMRDRHLHHYLRVVCEAQDDFEEKDFAWGRLAFSVEWDNIRQVAEWAVAINDAHSSGRLHRAVQGYMWLEANLEIGHWAVAAIEAGIDHPEVFSNAGTFMGYTGDIDREITFAQAGLALVAEPTAGEAVGCWANLFVGFGVKGDTLRSGEAAERAYQASKNSGLFHRAYYSGYSSNFLRDPEERRQRINESLDIGTRTGNFFAIGFTLLALGSFEREQRNFEAAFRSYREALELAKAHDLAPLRPNAARYIAMLASETGSAEPVQAWIDAFEASTHWLAKWGNFGHVALWWAFTGEVEAAAMIIGHMETHGIGVRGREEDLVRAQAILSQHADSERWKATGSAMDRADLFDYALRRLRELVVAERAQSAAL